MANVRWKDKTDIATLAAGDRMPVTDVSDASTDKYTTPAEIAAYAASVQAEVIAIAVLDETTALTTGTTKFSFDMPFAMTLSDIIATVTTAPTGASLIADVSDGGTSIMTTDKLEIEATETSTETAATGPALTDTALARNATITIDIDQVGSTIAGAGLKVYLIGTRI